jgi:acyl CoA:acetate/3-ketoacid CoA transferase beta subunit
MLVTDLGIFKKIGSEETFTLVAYFKKSLSSKDNSFFEIQEKCSWKIKAARDLEEVSPPTEEELYILRSLDPKGIYRGKN